MDQYLQQFKNLPRELKQTVSSEEKVKQLEEIEKRYNLKLIKLVVRVMVKDISWSEIEKFCQENFHLLPEKAIELKKELSEKIFGEVLAYLQQAEYRIQKIVSSRKEGEVGMVKNAPEEKNIQKEEVRPVLNTQKVKEDFQKIKPVINYNGSQDDFIKKIISELNLKFEDVNLTKRFENIIKSYFRDIRTTAQVEEVLRKPQKISGLGLSSEQANLVIKIIQEFKKQNNFSSKQYFVERESNKKDESQESSKQSPPWRDPARAGQVVNSSGKEILESRIQQVVSSSIKIEETQKKTSEAQKSMELQKRFEGGTIKPFFQKIEKALAAQPPKTNPQISQGKKVEQKTFKTGEGFSIPIKKPMGNNDLFHDVSNGRFKALGPAEELASITLDDLNHWGGGEATTKIILDKINLLKEISLIKKAEAISAWQKSPLYFLYIEIGRTALKNSKSISQIIEEKKKNNLPTIGLEDFEAISELNRKLRF